MSVDTRAPREEKSSGIDTSCGNNSDRGTQTPSYFFSVLSLLLDLTRTETLNQDQWKETRKTAAQKGE